MILDYLRDPERAAGLDVLDAETGEPHPNMDVFYADDEAGVIRYYLRGADGEFFLARTNNPGVPASPADLWQREDNQGNVIPGPHLGWAWTEAAAKIRIVPKAT